MSAYVMWQNHGYGGEDSTGDQDIPVGGRARGWTK